MGLGSILKKELEKQESDKKTISIVLESTRVNELDNIVKGFNCINPDKTFTRQRLIEIAIDNLIEESKKIIREHGVVEEVSANSVEYTPDEVQEEFDTVIFPAQIEGFNEAFLGEKKWYYVRLGRDKLDKIKYVACYVGAPVSAITHYAKVDRMESIMIEGKKKYIIYFEGEPVKLQRQIPIGNAPTMSMRANRYVSLEQLMNAESYEDLL